jgi:hypothetical protein
MKLQSAAHNEEPTFNVKTESGNLVFSFGDASTHAGSFVFQNMALQVRSSTHGVGQLLLFKVF